MAKSHIHSIAKHASGKLGFLVRTHGFFSSFHLLTIYKSQIHPSLECCSHVWSGAPKSTLCLLDKVQSKALRLINNLNLNKSLKFLSYRRLVAVPSIYHKYLYGNYPHASRDQGYYSCSSEECQDHWRFSTRIRQALILNLQSIIEVETKLFILIFFVILIYNG